MLFIFFPLSVFLGPFNNQHLLKILRAQGKKKIYSLYYSCSRHNPKALFCDSVNNCLIHVKQAAFHTHSVEKTAGSVFWPPKTTQTCWVRGHSSVSVGWCCVRGTWPCWVPAAHTVRGGWHSHWGLVWARNPSEKKPRQTCWIEHLGVFVLGGWGDVTARGMVGVFPAHWQIPWLPLRWGFVRDGGVCAISCLALDEASCLQSAGGKQALSHGRQFSLWMQPTEWKVKGFQRHPGQ